MHLLHPSRITLHPLPFTHHPSSITHQVAAPYAGALYPSWGASSVILYGLPSSPLAQPYNLIVGHVAASVVGLVTRLCFGDALQVNHTNAPASLQRPKRYTFSQWLGAAISVALSIVIMQALSCTHPPAGGTAMAGKTYAARRIMCWRGITRFNAR